MATTTAKTVVSEDNYNFLQRYVYQQSGIVLDDGKHYLLDARLTPLARRRQAATIDDLCNLLRATKEDSLHREVLDAMTTNETFFFRDVAPFDVLRDHILPEIRQKAALRPVSIWSAAASTGQEIYSIAMQTLEMGIPPASVKLFGTDVSHAVLERARQGKYMQIEVNRGLPSPYLVKYFERSGLDWQIKPNIRAMATFEQFDLRRSMTRFGPFDVVFCRNVLIYFDVKTRTEILKNMASVMPSGAWLILGSAETLLNMDCPFTRSTVQQSVLYRRI